MPILHLCRESHPEQQMVTYLPSKHFQLQYLGHTANKVTPHHLSHKRDQDFTNIFTYYIKHSGKFWEYC